MKTYNCPYPGCMKSIEIGQVGHYSCRHGKASVTMRLDRNTQPLMVDKVSAKGFKDYDAADNKF